MEDQVTPRIDRYYSLGLDKRDLREMTLEERALVLQLQVLQLRDVRQGDPFEGMALTPPLPEHSPGEKAAILLRFVRERRKLYNEEVVPEAKFGERFIREVPYDFSKTDLNILGLTEADLRFADFRDSDARGADLSEADLRDADLTGTTLEGCYLTVADLRGCCFRNCSGFPESANDALIDVRTFLRSQWTIPQLQLWQNARALVVGPDRFPLPAARALIPGSHSEPAAVFLSYGSCDSEIAGMVAEHLEERGSRVWFAEWDLDFGDDIVSEIEAGIEHCKAFVILASAESMKRPWVRQELSAALMKAIDDPHRLVIPLVLDSCTLPPFLASRKRLELSVPYLPIFDELSRRVRGEPRPRRQW